MSYRHVTIGETVEAFEDMMLANAEQELRVKGGGPWSRLAEKYARQLQMIIEYPFRDDVLDFADDEEADEISVKWLDKRNTDMKNLYRWGIKAGITGNHRIIYAIHEGYLVVFLHYFDKRYNGMIRRIDLEQAENLYQQFCLHPTYF